MSLHCNWHALVSTHKKSDATPLKSAAGLLFGGGCFILLLKQLYVPYIAYLDSINERKCILK
jgi:hypothetical protein